MIWVVQSRKWAWQSLVVAGLVFSGASALAHKSSDAYLRVSPSADLAGEQKGSISLQLSVAIRDADAAMDTLDANGDRRLTWREVRQAVPAWQNWITENIRWTCGDQSVDVGWQFDALEQRTDGHYVRMSTVVLCASPTPLALDYQLFRGIDPSHRLLVSGQLGGKPLALVLAPGSRSASTLGAADAGAQGKHLHKTMVEGSATLLHFISEGFDHILSGYDHLAFMLALLLPIALVAGAQLKSGYIQLLTTVTCFTIGHSITLALAGLGWITAPAQWVEPVIAISIGVSALLNLYPIKGLNAASLAAGFGLIHGLGFSSVLSEAGISDGLLVWALAGFNLGVESGQLILVALWCAVSMALSRWGGYQRFLVKGGSLGLILLSLYWTVQRMS